MKWILVVLAFTLSLNVQASRFKTESGKYIMAGDSVAQLMVHAGRPYNKHSEIVCIKEKRDVCLAWGRAEYWYYLDAHQDRLIWVITVINERITKMKWHRSR